jgi:hypothetical protein
MSRRASARIAGCHVQMMFFNLAVFANMMQMAIVQIVDMIAVLDPGVFAIRTMRVIVMGVKLTHF